MALSGYMLSGCIREVLWKAFFNSEDAEITEKRIRARRWQGKLRVDMVFDLFVEDNCQQGFVDFDFAVVFDETEFSEFVHEEIDAGTRSADHFGQGFL